MIVAPEPILGLEPDPVKIAREQKRLEALGRIALGVSVASAVLLTGMFLSFVIVSHYPDLPRRNPTATACFIGMLVGGLLCVLFGYILGACAKATHRGRRAQSLALASLALFLIVFLIYIGIHDVITHAKG